MNQEITPPNHVAIIMDGNGRWAASRSLPRVEGHRKGAMAAKETIKAALEFGIKHLTIYAFSSENWKRPKIEVDELMSLLEYYIDHELQKLHQEGVKLVVIGQKERLSARLQEKITYAETLTQDNNRLALYVAISYGAKSELVYACRKIIESRTAETVTEATISSNLYAPTMPDVDLLIRTSGEQRLSNFLLWQSAYAEFYFTKTLWPDFGKNDLMIAIEDFNKRKRNFGCAA